MAIYYVSTGGNNSGNGSSSNPWKTIDFGAHQLKAGDELVVKAGTYQERVWIDKGGSAAADIVIRSEVPGGAKIISPAGNYSTVNIRANYVTLDGFDVKGGTGHAFDADHVHHISVLNSVAHDSGGSGIGFAWTDFVTIEGNIAYNNAKTNGYHTSGISIYQAENLTGDTSSSGFRNVIRNNITYNNNESNVGGEHTDGNGIIIDDFQSTQNSGRSGYKFSTLVENNLSYNNGGKGIAVHWSDNVTVRNNTVWHNNLDNGNPGTWRGEISNQSSVNNTFVNNIMVADPKANSYNTAIGDYGTENKNNKWLNNITFNGTTGQASVRLDGGNPAPTTANGNLLGVDPKFVNPGGGDFHLSTTSPAINKGTTNYGVGVTDLDGGDRTVGQVDIGAFENGSAAAPVNRAPTNVALSLSTVSETAPAGTVVGQLSATDPDGDAVVFSLAGDSRFAVNGSGQIVVAQGANLAGDGDRPVALTVTASDGKGGEVKAGVTVTILDSAPTPGASNDTVSLPEDSTILINVLANDPSGATLTAVGGSSGLLAPAHGTIAIEAGRVRYTPSTDFAGSDKFEYAIRTSGGATSKATVNVTVQPVNDAPAAVDDTGFNATAGQALTILSSRLLANDRDVDGDTLTLTGVGGATNGTVARDAQGNVVFTAAAGATQGGFSYTVSDGKGGTVSANVSVAVGAPTGVRLWNGAAVPAIVTDSDKAAVELGMRFRTSVDGEIDSLMFYKGASNTGPHPIRVWTSSGEQLFTGTFANETAQGWQKLDLSKPLAISAGVTYTISYHAPKGQYSVSEGYFGQSVTNGPLTALADGGVYKYGAAGGFPTSTHAASNYWIDLLFDATKATKAGGTANDVLSGGAAADVILGRAGNDQLSGNGGADVLRGQAGNDTLDGGEGRDILIGGSGDDRFVFTAITHSLPGASDEMRAGDGGIAFQGAGAAIGDLIDVTAIDADTTVSGNQAFTFGSTGKGGLWLVNVGEDTVVRANVDGGAADFEILISDGAINASAYTAADFGL